MPNILDKIFADKKVELDSVKRKLALSDIKKRIQDRSYDIRSLQKSVRKEKKSHIIAEIKARTPFKGQIRDNVNPVDIAQIYFKNGASALSILTESNHFGGSITSLEQARKCVEIPLLRKDFIFDEYQVYESRAFGADFFLLIATWLDKNHLSDLISLGQELELAILVETHNERDMEKAFNAGASILGINNRDLTSGKTNLDIAKRLIPMALQIPESLIICESGIHSRKEIEEFENLGAHSFLIGETLMTADNIGKKLRELVGAKNISTAN